MPVITRDEFDAWNALTQDEKDQRVRQRNPHRKLLDKANACEHRGPVARDSGPCNCEVVCLIGKGLPILGTNQTGVNIAFCLSCVRSRADEGESQTP